MLGARAIICAINTRLTHGEVAYILEHSGAKLIFVDHESTHLVKDAKVPVVVIHDTGRQDDPYEQFLTAGRKFSDERGWPGLEWERDEDAACALNYTYVAPCYFTCGSGLTDSITSSGTTGRVSEAVVVIARTVNTPMTHSRRGCLLRLEVRAPVRLNSIVALTKEQDRTLPRLQMRTRLGASRRPAPHAPLLMLAQDEPRVNIFVVSSGNALPMPLRALDRH